MIIPVISQEMRAMLFYKAILIVIFVYVEFEESAVHLNEHLIVIIVNLEA